MREGMKREIPKFKSMIEVFDYVDKEADRRIKEMKENGELKPKNTGESEFKSHKDFLAWLRNEIDNEFSKDWMERAKE